MELQESIVKSNVTSKEAQCLLQIAEAQHKLHSAECIVLQQKILITKLLLELYLTQVDQIQQEENWTTDTSISKIRNLLKDISGNCFFSQDQNSRFFFNLETVSEKPKGSLYLSLIEGLSSSTDEIEAFQVEDKIKCCRIFFHTINHTSNRPMQGQGGQIAQLEQTILKMADPVQKKTRGVRMIDSADETNPMTLEPKKKKPLGAKKSETHCQLPCITTDF
ncbi:hypothetical protein BT96DRAFT_937957 [Gymnopus androsaceus JB14]|uniref:Uncharacterized protein n=1 Tax=Gymnopus androsaceus JB14 TaxID=1447944 RepID=A0A6A4HWV7_9AGAR|nr:hypothetical protein BT96DRAFT_937957 [Gymnopus androsaceus JB14]